MRLLLDTHVLLWALNDSKSLGTVARHELVSAVEVYVSAASLWEMRHKRESGQLQLPTGWAAAIIRSGYSELAVGWSHINLSEAIQLPEPDVYDSVLLAQAKTEQLTLLTGDPVILAAYPDSTMDARV
jgi:PIN domain nuclease of toxin-antitoxin system